MKVNNKMNIKGFFIGVYSFFSLTIAIILMYIFKQHILFIRKKWAASMIYIIGINIKKFGSLDEKADIIFLNHNSMLDIILLDYLHPKEIAWVTNMKFAKIPFFGLIFRLPNLILIDPNNKSSLRTLLKRSQQEIKNRRVIGIFPEATRGKDNEIIPFKQGARMITECLKLKVQTIVLTNTRERLDTKRLTASSGLVKIIYFDTFTPESKDWFKETEILMKDTYKQYAKD